MGNGKITRNIWVIKYYMKNVDILTQGREDVVFEWGKVMMLDQLTMIKSTLFWSYYVTKKCLTSRRASLDYFEASDR